MNTTPIPRATLTVNTAGSDIRYVVIKGAPFFFLLDDFTYTAIPRAGRRGRGAGAGRPGLVAATPLSGPVPTAS